MTGSSDSSGFSNSGSNSGGGYFDGSFMVPRPRTDVQSDTSTDVRGDTEGESFIGKNILVPPIKVVEEDSDVRTRNVFSELTEVTNNHIVDIHGHLFVNKLPIDLRKVLEQSSSNEQAKYYHCCKVNVGLRDYSYCILAISRPSGHMFQTPQGDCYPFVLKFYTCLPCSPEGVTNANTGIIVEHEPVDFIKRSDVLLFYQVDSVYNGEYDNIFRSGAVHPIDGLEFDVGISTLKAMKTMGMYNSQLSKLFANSFFGKPGQWTSRFKSQDQTPDEGKDLWVQTKNRLKTVQQFTGAFLHELWKFDTSSKIVCNTINVTAVCILLGIHKFYR